MPKNTRQKLMIVNSIPVSQQFVVDKHNKNTRTKYIKTNKMNKLKAKTDVENKQGKNIHPPHGYYRHPFTSNSRFGILKRRTPVFSTHISNLLDSNIFNFFKHTTPTISFKNEKSKLKKKKVYQLKEVWNFYDEPYGIEIPITFAGKQEKVYFVPHLSGLQIYKKGEKKPSFEYFETLKPDLRYPCIDKIEELSVEFPFLLNGSSSELNLEKSWYSIAWYPILCHRTTINLLKGQMLTYHSFNASHDVVVDLYNLSNSLKYNVDIGSKNEELYLPVIGFIPYKIRNDVWFKSNGMDNRAFYGPLYLMQATRMFLNDANVRHPDYYHCTNTNILMDFLKPRENGVYSQ